MQNKKYKLVLVLLLTIFTVSILAACGSEDTGQDSRLVGSWVSTINDFEYEFNADGTGIRGTPGFTESIRWATEGNNELVLTIGNTEERWGYRIRRNNIYFTHEDSPGMEYPFTRDN